MYRMHKKSRVGKDRNLQLQDCIAVQTKYWFWILAVLVAGSVIYAITASYGQRTVYSSIAESYPQGGQLQTIASTKCPYCSGFLDAQGRCNMRGCLIYSPNWGKPSRTRKVFLLRRCSSKNWRWKWPPHKASRA